MKIQVRLFAAAKQLAQRETLEVEVSATANLADLRQTLARECPDLAPLVSRAMFAIGGDFADDAALLSETQDVACLPPVSGG